MRTAVTLPPFGPWSDPRVVMTMAAEAEAAGWDGFFLWDHVSWNPAWGENPAIADPWLCLAAAATVTSRVLLGTMVTPLPRRRPQIVAREVVTLDHLSGGRAVLGVGLGVDFEYKSFGESSRDLGRRLDEALAVLTGLLRAERLDFDGAHHTVHSPPLLPPPVNGSIPIWVGGHWPNPGPFERAGRYDGVVPRKQGSATGLIEPGDLVAMRVAIGRDDSFAYVASGSTSSPRDNATIAEWETAGANWWMESLHPFGGRQDAMRDRLRAGPPTG